MFNAARVLPFTGKAAEYGGLLLTVQREKGKAIEWPDTMLAAHALALDATVVTDNNKHFIRSGCKLENWRTA
jgi:tRNA(fMet)-specific endonuclease VapC